MKIICKGDYIFAKEEISTFSVYEDPSSRYEDPNTQAFIQFEMDLQMENKYKLSSQIMERFTVAGNKPLGSMFAEKKVENSNGKSPRKEHSNKFY